ncbi:hypothetical protein [Caudoviricetes sp.]|nr:hypothetical protein [Caudoviricetes sp.]
MNLATLLNKIKQLEAFIALVEKFKPFKGDRLSQDQWVRLFQVDSEKAFTLLDEHFAGVLVQLAEAFPKKEDLKGDQGESIQGEKGEDGPSVDDIVSALKNELIRLASQIEVPEERLIEIQNSIKAEMKTAVAEATSKIKVPVAEKVIVKEPQVTEKTNVIYQKVEFDFVANLIENKLSVRNALEAIEEDKDKLSIDAVGGLTEELTELRKLIQNIKIDRVDYWGGGLDEGEVVAIVNKILATLPGTSLTWEYYATNWSIAPTLNSTITGGSVYNYTLDGTTRYRFVPDPYDSTQDAFYTTFSVGVLSGILVTRG